MEDNYTQTNSTQTPLVLTQEELSTLEKISEGKCGVVYKGRDGNAYKMKKIGSDTPFSISREKIQQFSSLESDICIFPEQALESEDGELLGYSMKFAPGKPLPECIETIPFVQLEQALVNAETSLAKHHNINSEDLHSGNILWNEQEGTFKIIDTDVWHISNDSNDTNLLSSFSSSIITSFTSCRFHNILSPGEPQLLSAFLSENEEYRTFMDELYTKARLHNEPLSAVKVLKKIQEIFSKEFGTEITNFQQAEEPLNNWYQEKMDYEYDMKRQEMEAAKPLNQIKTFFTNIINVSKSKVGLSGINNILKSVRNLFTKNKGKEENEHINDNDNDERDNL